MLRKLNRNIILWFPSFGGVPKGRGGFSPDGNGKLFAKMVWFFLLPKRDHRKRFREL
jgi:hypothetical protein